jgi:hypothetical protein
MEKTMNQPTPNDVPNPEPATRTVELSPALTPPGQQLTEAERLSIENVYLRMQNMQLQVQNLDNTKAAIIEQMRALQAEMEQKKTALSEKYGVDIGRTTVKADGSIVPKTANGD